MSVRDREHVLRFPISLYILLPFYNDEEGPSKEVVKASEEVNVSVRDPGRKMTDVPQRLIDKYGIKWRG